MIAKIAIASTLKPVIDPRAYEKIGVSLSETDLYDVHILGSKPTTDKIKANITLHPISSYPKHRLKRLILPWKIFTRLLKIRPDLLIFNTHELLFMATIYKMFTGSKLVYDIRENYFFNLLYQKNYPWGLRHLLGFYIRCKEVLLTNFIDYFLLAEQCYAYEIKFIKQNFSVIENKFLPAKINLKQQNNSAGEFVISGTISREYGVFDALHFFNKISGSKYKLIIVGHCPNYNTFRELEEAVSQHDNIDFIVSTTPIPHQEILSQIGNHSIGLLPYQVNKSTQNKIPTKLYEYIGLGIPIIISPNPLWDDIIEKYHAGLSMDFKLPLTIDEIRQSLTLKKTTQIPDLKGITWNNEEIKLLAVVQALLS